MELICIDNNNNFKKNTISTYRRVGHTSAHRVRRIPVRRRIPSGKTRSGGCDGQRRFAGHHFFRSIHHGHHTICGNAVARDEALLQYQTVIVGDLYNISLAAVGTRKHV